MQTKNYLQQIKESPCVTIILVAVNIIIFLLCTFTGEMLYNIGGLSPEHFIMEGEYYRLFLAMFLHADIYHLVNNMLLLAGIGVMLEKEIGHLTFFLLYLFSGIGGQIVSLSYKVSEDQWFVTSIGASGAVFGLVGVLLAVSIFFAGSLQSVTWQRIAVVVVYSIYSGVRSSNIDNAAHVGGFITGLVLGMVVCIIFRFFRRKNS